MKTLQLLTKDLEHYPNGINWPDFEIKLVDEWESVDKNIPILSSADLMKLHIRYYMNNRQPAIYIGRGYVGNHMYKTRQLWRYSVNGWANTKLLPIPYPRWDSLMKLERHPWKVKEVKNVLIATSKNTQPIFDPVHGYDWAEYMAEQFPGANIKIRHKPKKSGPRWATLWEDLDWADLIVSQGSAITAEAFWYGKKVISTHPCTTWAAGSQLIEDWQNPTEPVLRDQWHEHLAWSQFTITEWESGEAMKLIEQYIGPIENYKCDYNYDFQLYYD